MTWSRSETLALAQQACVHCLGLGLVFDRSVSDRTCECVLRAIFRACYAKFRRCACKEKFLSRTALDVDLNRMRRNVWGMKNEEYIADFTLIAKRELGEGTLAHKLFTYHFLLGAEWGPCSAKLGIDRGTFFHEVYRIQVKLGRAYRETRPYALFPIDEYFCGLSRATSRDRRTLTAGGFSDGR